MKRGWRTALLAGIAACLALPASASAASTFGANVDALTADQNCGDCATVTFNRSDGSPETGSPISGVLVKARYRTAGPGGPGAVTVLRPTAVTTEFFNVASTPITIPSDLTPGGTVREVATRVSINAGDRVGLEFPNLAPVYLHSDPDATCAARDAPHPPGTTQPYIPGFCLLYEILVQGIVEPDADGDGFGDETQDLCPTNASLQTACPKKRCKKGFKLKKVKTKSGKKKKKCVRKKKRKK